MKADPRLQRIEARLQLLEVEAQLQRTTLASHMTQWEQRQPLAWVGTAARIAGHMAGPVLTAPDVRWLLLNAGLSLFRTWRAKRASPTPHP